MNHFIKLILSVLIIASSHINNVNAQSVHKYLTVLPHEPNYEQLVYLEHDMLGVSVPESFDTRTNWPQCASISGHVRDQSNCGSCWAFGSTEAFNDRYCIKTGDNTTLFSTANTLACCSGLSCGMSQGCNGGQPGSAWKWFVNTGVMSGGDYGDKSTCEPYPFPSCAHHVEPPTGMVACSTLPEYSTPKCVSTCDTGSELYTSDKRFKASSFYSLKRLDDVYQDIMKYGTVTATLSVYEDFESYTGGVYKHLTGKYLGGHAIKLIGWGVDQKTKEAYWLCVNSWNESWGEKGAFRILRGSNECGIEAGIVAGQV